MRAPRKTDIINPAADVVRIASGLEPVRLPGLEAYRALWCAVLHEALKDLNGRMVDGTRDAALRRDKAMSWIGTRDFNIVCALAGFDGDVVAQTLRRRIAAADGRFSGQRRRQPRNPPPPVPA